MKSNLYCIHSLSNRRVRVPGPSCLVNECVRNERNQFPGWCEVLPPGWGQESWGSGTASAKTLKIFGVCFCTGSSNLLIHGGFRSCCQTLHVCANTVDVTVDQYIELVGCGWVVQMADDGWLNE